MTYRVVKDDDDVLFSVVEVQTELVVYTSPKEVLAKKTCKSLNLGAGFQGFTPEFFTKEFVVKMG